MDTLSPAEAGSTAVELAGQALPSIRDYLRAHPEADTVSLLVSGDETGRAPEPLVVPRSAVEFFAQVLAHLAAGRGMSLVPQHAELTTQEAADLLNVSRPYLIGLLTAGEIEYRTVGKHRRVRADTLLDYKRQDDQRRRAAADELTGLSGEMGLA